MAFILGYCPFRLPADRWIDYVSDDAFYYLVVARRIATQGISSFDGLTLTNGYHPLWQGVLALQYFLIGETAIVVCSWLVFVLAVLLVCRAVEAGDGWLLPLLAALLTGVVAYPLVLSGMEAAIAFLTFGAFVLALKQATRRDGDAVLAVAATGSLVVASRIDAAVFIVPAILLAGLDTTRKLRVLLLMAAAGAIYVVANQLVFGTWLPISGLVKSLGGAGLNQALLQQLVESTEDNDPVLRSVLDVLRGMPGRTVAIALVTAALVAAVPDRRSFAARLAVALLLGFVAFVARLLFFSSWRIWDWYAYPVFFFLIVDALMIATLLAEARLSRRFVAAGAIVLLILTSAIFTWRAAALAAVVLAAAWGPGWRDGRVARRMTAGLGVVLLVMAAHAVITNPPLPNPAVATFAQPLAEQVRAVTGQAPVGMGDNAGAFAWFYGGPVHQLEGLVNDREYFDRVRARQPLEPLLCARGVRFIVSYQPDLGDYDTFEYRPYRPLLTTYDGPRIRLSKANQVAKITDAQRYGVVDTDSIVYVWRLSC